MSALSGTVTTTVAAARPQAGRRADFDGYGTTEIALFRPFNRGWYRRARPPFGTAPVTTHLPYPTGSRNRDELTSPGGTDGSPVDQAVDRRGVTVSMLQPAAGGRARPGRPLRFDL